MSILLARPENDLEMLELLSNKFWRLNNLYYIVNKQGVKQLFTMNYAQLNVNQAHRLHPRIVVLKSRQQGISTYELVDTFDDGVFRDDYTAGLMAQGKRESGILLQRSKLLWKEFPAQIKSFLGLSPTKDNTEAIKFSNGSTLLIGVSFRSQTLQRLHVSELGKIAAEQPKRVEETFTGSLQALAAGNLACLESTAEGDNAFKEIWDKATMLLEDKGLEGFGPKDFYPLFLSWSDDPDCQLTIRQEDTDESLRYFEELEELYAFVPTDTQKWWWISQYRELEGKIYQEYPFSPEEAFKASIDAAYWSSTWRDCGIVFKPSERGQRKLPDGAIIEWYPDEYAYDERLELHCVQDLGINDYNTILIYQRHAGKYRVIGEYWNNNRGVRHYMNWIRRFCVDIGAGWRELRVHLPHDATKRAQTDLVTVVDMYEEEGWQVDVLERTNDKLGDINMVRWEVEQAGIAISSECEYARKTMSNYRREFDAKLEVWKNTPLHDEYSHMADSLIYMIQTDVRDESARGYSFTSSGV